jgi:carboxypeptidase family protein
MRALHKSALRALGVLGLCLPASTALAQVDTGTILGTVKDASGGVVSGAKVTATHEGQGFSLTRTTRADGTYIFTPIRTGVYVVEVESAGFKKVVRRGVELNLQQQAVVDVNLETGGIEEAVEVTAEVPLLQTQTGEVGHTLTSGTIEDLPINGRDYTALARLSAGTARPQQGARAPLQFTANGTRPGQNNYMLDGIDNNTSNVDFLGGTAYVVKPPVDAIAEIKVLTSSFGAEYGRAGGAVLSATLKSGSNEFHGSAWEFNRNDSLKAAEFFENARGLKKGRYDSNQFGFTAGGPVVKGKTFFFADYEGSITRQDRIWQVTVPTERQRASGFTDWSDLITGQSGTRGPDLLGRSVPLGTIFDPATTRSVTAGQVDPVTGRVATGTGFVRDPFPGNIIPAGRLDPNAIKLMSLFPAANQAGLINNFATNRLNTEDIHTFDVRVDHDFSQSDHAFVRYSFADIKRLKPGPFEGPADGGAYSEGDETGRTHGLALSYTKMFSSTLINEARFGFSREYINRLQPLGDDTNNIPADYGIEGIPQIAGNGGLPLIFMGDLRQFGAVDWLVAERLSNTLQLTDNLTKIYKSHTFKTGFMAQRIALPWTGPPWSRGRFNFDGFYTSIPNRQDLSTGRAQFLLKPIASTVPGGVDFVGGADRVQASPFGEIGSQRSYFGAYLQDSWRASSKFTLNYGLRWDYFSLIEDDNWEQANFVPNGAGGPQYIIPERHKDIPLSQSFRDVLARDGIALVYSDEFGSGIGRPQKHNFAPRLDFAWQPYQKLVVRGGYGLFYGAFENRGGNPSLGYNYPFQFTLNYQRINDVTPVRYPDGSLATIGRGLAAIPLDNTASVPGNSLNLRGVSFDYKTPYVQTYNLTFQHELGSHHSVEVGYVGSRSSHVETFVGSNGVTQVVPPGLNANNFRTFRSFTGGFNFAAPVGSGTYHSMQSKFIRRMHRGLQFQINYTLAESRSNYGDLLSSGGFGPLRGYDLAGWGGLENEWGLSYFHTKHALIFNGVWELPGKGALLGGWNVSWILMAYSGQPQTIGCTVATTSGLGCIALLVGDPYSGKHDISQFYNPDAFRDPPVATAIGQSDFSPLGGERSQVTGPPFRQLDMAIAKQIRVKGARVELRAEAFNVTNTPSFQLPSQTNFSNRALFGLITATSNNARQVQLGAKLYW